MKRIANQGSKRRFVERAAPLIAAGAWAGLRLFGRVVGFMAASAQTSPANDALNSAIRGGLLNYRTGKFDDGTDPGGIYKPD